MPIWRSSELPTDRPGSPARRRSSARASASSQPSSSRAQALPPLRNSADGSNPDEHQSAGSASAAAAGPPQAACHPNALRSPSSCSSVNSLVSWEGAPPTTFNSHGAPSGIPGPPQRGGLSRQASRPDSRGTAVTAVVPGVRSNTYTVQYIGIANGELGILSQKQKLTVPVTVPGAAGSVGPVPASNIVVCRRHSRTSTGAPALAAAAATVRPPLPPSRPGSSLPARPQLTAVVPDPTDPGPIPHDITNAAATAAAAGGATETEADDDSPVGAGPAKAPSLVSIVDDAHGQVKVISECFYSRALQSRGGPRDRHTRRNRPMGPQVRDMEPLSSALPGRFGNRAPSAGGFPGWKLTAAAGAPPPPPSSSGSGAGGGTLRRTYSGTGSGYGTGAGFGSGSASRPGTGSAGVVRQQQQQQRGAGSAWPAEGTGAAGVVAVTAAAMNGLGRPVDAAGGRRSEAD